MKTIIGEDTSELDLFKPLIINCKVKNIKILTDDDYKRDNMFLDTKYDIIMDTKFIKNINSRFRNGIIRNLCNSNVQSLKELLASNYRREYETALRQTRNVYDIHNYRTLYSHNIQDYIYQLYSVRVERGPYGTSVVNEYRGMEKIFMYIFQIYMNITSMKMLNGSSRKLRKRLKSLNEDYNRLRNCEHRFTTSPIPGNNFSSKIDKVITGVNTLKNNKDKRILVFANSPHLFEQIKIAFKGAKTKFIEFKGNSNTITKRIRDYNSGKEPIMLLNAKFFASGINLPNTTDIFIIQNLDKYTIKQIIGRAKRIGKEDCKSLTVHTILYNIEKQIVFRDDKAEEK